MEFRFPAVLLLLSLPLALGARVPSSDGALKAPGFRDATRGASSMPLDTPSRRAPGRSQSSLVPTPPMGWNSWNHFGCGVTEDIVRGTADALVSSGLAALGYTFLNVDDCWASGRDAEGRLVADPLSFPSGMRALSEYTHSRGLKLGIYSDAGFKTCAGRPGSLGFERQDARTFADWGVDYLKYDNCYSDTSTLRTRYLSMRDALNATGRPIVYSMCEWGLQEPATWARGVAGLWRTTFDIVDTWASVLQLADSNDRWAQYAGPGGWNDPDMLQVGNGGLTASEDRAHFSLWAAVKAPLLVGADVRAMGGATLGILGNREVIAVNQDPLGVQARKVQHSLAQGDIWTGPLSGGSQVVVAVNRAPVPLNISLPWATLGLPEHATYAARDLWKHQDLEGPFSGVINVAVKPHDVAMLVLSPAMVKKAKG